MLASKLLSLIGELTGDNVLKEKITMSNMSVKAITEAVHYYMYENWTKQPNVKTEKTVKYLAEV